MREDYKLKGELKKIDVEIEKDTAEKILEMEKHTKLSRSELANVAFKRFISAHKDFLPPSAKK